MNLITLSREFGSGGRELGKRLAEHLGFDYYDKEIITAIAAQRGLDEKYVERELDNQAWQSFPLTFRRSFTSGVLPGTAQTSLLLEQKKVVEGIARRGRNCVIVGRNADVLLAGEGPFNLFVCADLETRVRRCIERAEPEENLSEKEIRQLIRRIDKSRAAAREILTNSPWGERGTYHLTVNTTGWDFKELTPAVADFAVRWFRRKA